MASVLFVCRHNAGRSQMSQALFQRVAGGRHRALSAGSEADPNGRVHPEVVEVMSELGIDLSDHRPQRLTHQLAQQAEIVVTMGCGDACPYIPGKRYIDWELEDPESRPVQEVRTIRDDIARRVEQLIDDLDKAPPSRASRIARRELHADLAASRAQSAPQPGLGASLESEEQAVEAP
jgi:arsenate reductase